MKDLTKKDLKLINDAGNVIEIYDEQINCTLKFYYIYSGDSIEAVFLNNRFYEYFDLDEYIDKIKTRKDEKKYLTKLIKESLEFMHSNNLEEFNGGLIWIDTFQSTINIE